MYTCQFDFSHEALFLSLAHKVPERVFKQETAQYIRAMKVLDNQVSLVYTSGIPWLLEL